MARASARPPLSGRINCGVIESLTHAAPPQVKKIFRHRTWAVTIFERANRCTSPGSTWQMAKLCAERAIMETHLILGRNMLGELVLFLCRVILCCTHPEN